MHAVDVLDEFAGDAVPRRARRAASDRLVVERAIGFVHKFSDEFSDEVVLAVSERFERASTARARVTQRSAQA